MTSPNCPCGTGQRYRDCCQPRHRGTREAESAEALMRSRFSAFAMGEAGYLWKTLASGHADRSVPEVEAIRQIRQSASSYRYRSLAILDTLPADKLGIAQVLFLARVFRKGADVSFVELSDFVHEDGWRYLRGDLLPVKSIAGDPFALRIGTFTQLHNFQS